MKYHIRDSGEPGRCIAQPGHCKYGSESEHHSSPEDARTAYEQSQSGSAVTTLTKASEKDAAPVSEKSARIDRALSSDLTYNGPTPRWLKKLQKESEKRFGGESPKIIDVIDTPAGKMAVVWETNSMAENDSRMPWRGFVIRSTCMRDMKTGETLGYVKTTFVDDGSVKAAFGNDKWASLRYKDEFSGSDYGCRTYVETDEVNRQGRKVNRKVDSLGLAKTPEEVLEVKRNMWAKSHAALRLTPESYAASSKDSKDKYYLGRPTIEAAPNDEAVLMRDMDQVLKVTNKDFANFKKDFKDPFIDYSSMDQSLQGTGLGSSLYVYSARMLGKENKILRSSGLQSDQAKTVWDRFKDDARLPVRAKKHKFSSDDRAQDCYVMDFRKS